MTRFKDFSRKSKVTFALLLLTAFLQLAVIYTNSNISHKLDYLHDLKCQEQTLIIDSHSYGKSE